MILGSSHLVQVPARYIVVLVATYGAAVGCTCQEVLATRGETDLSSSVVSV
jgi:hypothetical protein